MATTAATAPSTQDLSPPGLRTCILCRQRRVKCDRQVPRCSSCVRCEASCIYPPGRGRAPKRPRRDVPAPQVSERLSRLESIISQLGAATKETSHARGAGEKPNTQPFEQDFSRLKIDESESYYVNNALWVTLSDEVEELRDLLFEPASDDAASYDTTPSPYPPYSSSTTTGATTPYSPPGLNAAIFGYRAVCCSLQHFHPSLPQAVTLFAAFSDNVAPLVRIFHMPTLTRIYWDAVASLDSLDYYTETLLFAIHYSALISLTPEQCLGALDETRETALERYRFAVEQALARGNLLNTQNMTMLRAAVLFLSALPNEDDSRVAWSLTSLIYHIARTTGLHRDGTVFGLRPFETEMRRRLWWQICTIDSRSSEYHCNEPIARGFASDTKPPLHIDDADISPEMVEPPEERWDRATDMTLSLVRCEAIQTGWKLGLFREKQISGPGGSSTSPAADDSRDAPTKRRALVQNLEARLRDRYLPICDPSVPFQLLSAAVARIIIARFQLITQYPLVSREAKADHGRESGTRELESNMHNELFQISTEILEVSGVLLTNPDIMQWTWYSKTHIQWGAMAFVLSELCARPVHSPECDRAWDCVTAVYDGWRTVGGNQDDEGRLALWRPIRRLMAKARYVREVQRTDPARGAGRRAPQRYGPAAASCPPPTAAGGPWSPLHHPLAGHITTGSRYAPSQQTMSSTPTPEYSRDTTDALQRVLGTEPLGAFMDLFPDWSWADNDSDTNPSVGGIDFGFHPSLP